MLRQSWLGAGAWVAGLVPACALIVRLTTDSLGANPVEELTHESGIWALRWLLASLAVTPLRQTAGWSRLAPLRRTFGLLAFGYALLHFLVYAVLDQGLDFRYLADDLAERPYIFVGFSSFLLLLPLAVTSTRGWMRRLGKRWVTLHRASYVAGVAAVLHFMWLVKADLREPLLYTGVLSLLLGARVFRIARKRFTSGTASA